MAYPSKFKEIEERLGKPIALILVDKLNQHGDISKVARDPEIDMSYDNVYDKVKECGIVKDPPVWRILNVEAEHAEP